MHSPRSMVQSLLERIAFIRFHLVHRRGRRAIQRWQVAHLKRMLAHAEENVPLYQELFQAHVVSSAQVQSLHDFEQFPVVTKRDFFGKDVEYYTNNADLLHGTWATTSGTSGEPFTMLSRGDFRKPYYAESIIYRTFLDTGVYRFERKPRIARIMTKSPPQVNRLFLNIADVRTDPRKAIERIAEFKPVIIESFASVLYTIAETVEREHLTFRVPYAISGGERLTHAMREYISRVLGCEIFNRYGMEEFTVLAMECQAHDGMHINCESLIVEVLDDEGVVVAEGETGRIAVTDLFNDGMPLIRYDTGDHGRVVWTRCTCGKSSPRVWIEGRYSASLTFSGKQVHHLEFDAALEMFMNVVLQYLVVKESDTEATVVLIPGRAYSEASERQIVNNIRALVGERVRVGVERVTHMPALPRGKSRIVHDRSDTPQ